MNSDPLFFLNHDQYGTYSRCLARTIGIINAVLLSDLVERRSYHAANGELIDHPEHGKGLFYYTCDKGEERTGITRREQDTALKKLQDLGLIKMIVFGLPAKRHFLLNDDKILELYGFSKNSHYFGVSVQLETQKRQTWCTKTPLFVHGSAKVLSNIKNPIRTTNEDTCAPEFFAKIDEPEKTQRRGNVATSEAEHSDLLEKFGPDFVERCYDELSSWKDSATKAQVAKHKSDYRRITNWVAQTLQEKDLKDREIKQRSERLNGSSSVTQSPGNETLAKEAETQYVSEFYEIKVYHDTVEFNPKWGNKPPTILKFSENGFNDQLKSLLFKYQFERRK